jgi:tetrapyrrole methylase family protein/MazG family protein
VSSTPVDPEPPSADELLSHVPQGPVPSSQHGQRLLDVVRVMARLRAPDGCPWDAEQTHRTLARHLLEETHELIEAIEADDDDAMRDELGDVLLQVVFHAQLAADDGRWDVDDVAEGLAKKLIYRHPHVFGEVDVTGADEVLVNWEQLKAAEAESRVALEDADGEPAPRPQVDEDIPAALPALARASKAQRRAAGRGFAWRTSDGAFAALREEVEELANAEDPADIEDEVGDVLFATVAVARTMGVDAETALRRAVRGFAERYERFEALAAERGIDVEAADEDEVRALFRLTKEP